MASSQELLLRRRSSVSVAMTIIFLLTRTKAAELPRCARDCHGLESVAWEDDVTACNWLEIHGFGCLEDCSIDDLSMGGAPPEKLPLVCHWTLLSCENLAVDMENSPEDACPEICTNRECLKAYDKLKQFKREFDLHRKCAKKCH